MDKWELRHLEDHAQNCWGVYDEKGIPVYEECGEMAETRARLIVAAPDLLEACREALTCNENRHYGLRQKVTVLVENAIAKAEGKGPT